MSHSTTPPGADNPAFADLDRLNTREAADYLGVDTRTIGYHKRMGHIVTAPGSRSNSSLFAKEALNRLFADKIRKRPAARKARPPRNEALDSAAFAFSPFNPGFRGAFRKGWQAAEASGYKNVPNPYPATARHLGFFKAWHAGYTAALNHREEARYEAAAHRS